MNKHCCRLIFNRARGLLLAVAETVSSRSKAGRHGSHGVGQSRAIAVTLKPLTFSIWSLLGLVMVPVAQADIIADPSAPGNQQATILQSASGVPLVNIQTPSAAGVSRNVYTQFDVASQGAILNNSSGNVQTQLGGWVQGNPNLAGGTARVILNEVNSSNPSLLNGYVEIAGSRAQLIIANPSGISCDGCGFINANRTTLTTGTPILSNGNLLGYRVGGGTISVNGNGLDARQSDYTDILARAVSVNAGIWTNTLNVTTGTHQINVDSSGNTTSTSTSVISPSTSGNPSTTPAFALDIAALGGMYAGKIHLIGTEAGLGVRNAGSLGASVGEFTITNDGHLVNTGSITANANLDIASTKDIQNSGIIYAQGNTSLSATNQILNTKLIGAQANTALTVSSSQGFIEGIPDAVFAAGFNIDGTLGAAGNLIMHAGSGGVNVAGANVASAGNLVMETTGSLILDRASVTASQLEITAQAFSNIAGHMLHTGKSLSTIYIADTFNNSGGTIAGNGVLAIEAGQLDNSTGTLYAATDMSILSMQGVDNTDGVIQTQGDLNVISDGALTNLRGTVEASGASGKLTLKAISLDNSDGRIVNQGMGDTLIDGGSQIDNRHEDGITGMGLIAGKGNLTVLASNLDNTSGGSIWAGLDLGLTITNQLDGNAGTLYAGRDLRLDTATFLNTAGAVSVQRDLAIQAQHIIGVGDIGVGRDAALRLGSDFTNTKGSSIKTNGNLDISVNGYVVNQATMEAVGSLTLHASAIDNQKEGVIASRATTLKSDGLLVNAGSLNGDTLETTSDSLSNTGTLIGSLLKLTANSLENNGSTAVIAATENIDLQIKDLLSNKDEATIYSLGDLKISSDGLDGRTSSILNSSATIQAEGDLTLYATNLSNQKTTFSTELQQVSEVAYSSGYLPNLYQIWHTYWPSINGKYSILRVWQTGTVTTTETVVTADSVAGQILSGGNMRLTVDDTLLNQYSSILAGGDLSYAVGTLTNIGQEKTTITKSQGNYVGRLYKSSDGDCNGNPSADYYRDCNTHAAYSDTVITSSTLPDGVAVIAANQSLSGSSVNLNNQTVNVSVIGGNASTLGAADNAVNVSSLTQANQGALNNTIPNNGLFHPSPDLTSHYLVETNPRFANYKTWLSSDYMLTQLGFDPALTLKRLGDGFYEQKLVREQVAELTGKRYLSSYASDEEEYQALLNAGVVFAKQYQLTPGTMLTESQMAALTGDIVWLVEQEVTLPDGSVTKGLVPQVYIARLGVNDLQPSGALIVADNVDLHNANTLANAGTIHGTSLQLAALSLDNTGGKIVSDTDLKITVDQDLINRSGIIRGQDVVIDAGRDIINTTAMAPVEDNGTSNTLLSQRGAIRATSNLNLTANRDIVITGSDIAAEGNANLSAGRNLTVDTQVASKRYGIIYEQKQQVSHLTSGGNLSLQSGADTHLTSAELDAGNKLTVAAQGSLTIDSAKDTTRADFNFANKKNRIVIHDVDEAVQHSVLNAAGDISLSAGTAGSVNALTIRAAQINSEAGAVNIAASGNVEIEAEQEAHESYHEVYTKKSGFLSSSKRLTIDQSERSLAVGSDISAENITIQSGDNLNVSGSNIVSSNGTFLTAKNDVVIESATNTSDETHYSQKSKSGFSASGSSIGYSSSKLTQNQNGTTVTQQGSTVGSVNGDVTIDAGKTYTQTASDVLAPNGDISITAQQVNIEAANTTSTQTTETKYKQTGLSLTITNPVISAIQTASQMAEAASNTSDSRMQLLAAATTGLSASNAYDAVSAGQGVDLPNGKTGQIITGKDAAGNVTSRDATAIDKVGGINVSLSLGTSKSQSSSTQTSSQAQGSTLQAGGDITIKATRVPAGGITTAVSQQAGNSSATGQDSDITITGSTVSAGNNVSLKADDEISLVAAQNTDTLTSKNKNSSASVGVSIGTNGLAVTASASMGKGKANGTDVTWTETQVTGGNNVTLESGTDTTLIGAQVKGEQVVANVGTSGEGNLTIASLQDTSTYDSKQKSMGISVSVPIGAGTYGGSLSISNTKINSDYASVNEQAGIYAGDQGFQVNVNGNTDLKGAVFASTETAITTNKNSLTTDTLTVSNINNSAEYDAWGLSVSAGVTVGLPNNDQLKVGATKSMGWGSLSDEANSVTVSGVSGGYVSITDSASQKTLTGKDSTIALENLNRDVKTLLTTDAQGNVISIGVDSSGNNLAGVISPMFNKEKVESEIQAQVQITQAFDKAQQQTKININKQVDAAKAERDKVADQLKNTNLSESERQELIVQGLNAQKEMERLENISLIFSSFTGGLSAPTNSAIGIVANTLAPEVSSQIGQYFKDHGTEGSASHILAHGVLASAVSVVGGNDPIMAAVSAMGGELAAPLIADFLYGKTSENLSAEQKATVSAIASLGSIAVDASAGGDVADIAQANAAAQNAVENNWGVVGHYSTMATVLYLAGFSPKDAKAIALAAWGPDTDKRNAITIPNVVNGKDASQPQIANHGLDGEKDPTKVIAEQQALANQVGKILMVIKQYENDPATKALYLSQPVVQQILHLFGDSFAHVKADGTHYEPQIGHGGDGSDPDNPHTQSNAYINYASTLFNVASKVTVVPRVGDDYVENLAEKVTVPAMDFKQKLILYDAIGNLSKQEAASLVISPVKECGLTQNCQNVDVGSKVNPEINKIYQ